MQAAGAPTEAMEGPTKQALQALRRKGRAGRQLVRQGAPRGGQAVRVAIRDDSTTSARQRE
jgi:hypothetical protein